MDNGPESDSPARFYTLGVPVDGSGLNETEILDAIVLHDASGEPFTVSDFDGVPRSLPAAHRKMELATEPTASSSATVESPNRASLTGELASGSSSSEGMDRKTLSKKSKSAQIA